MMSLVTVVVDVKVNQLSAHVGKNVIMLKSDHRNIFDLSMKKHGRPICRVRNSPYLLVDTDYIYYI